MEKLRRGSACQDRSVQFGYAAVQDSGAQHALLLVYRGKVHAAVGFRYFPERRLHAQLVFAGKEPFRHGFPDLFTVGSDLIHARDVNADRNTAAFLNEQVHVAGMFRFRHMFLPQDESRIGKIFRKRARHPDLESRVVLPRREMDQGIDQIEEYEKKNHEADIDIYPTPKRKDPCPFLFFGPVRAGRSHVP